MTYEMKITILGSTGSIGKQTLNVVDKLNSISDKTGIHIKVRGLAAGGSRLEEFRSQVDKYKPDSVAIYDPDKAHELSEDLGRPVLSGQDGLDELAVDAESDLIVVSVVGSVGFLPTLHALLTGHRVALANKETLVMGGTVIRNLIEKVMDDKLVYKYTIPIDSEHSAIFQSIVGEDPETISRIIITASGGALRDLPDDKLADVSVEDVLRHPNWSMGAKITVDSATLMNKGLEIIEAHHLYGIPYDRIVPVLHRESIVHSLVEFTDGSTKAQLSYPNMEIPIQYAILHGTRLPWWEGDVEDRERDSQHDILSVLLSNHLTFEEIDISRPRYACLRIAVEMGKKGGVWPAIMNAANEVAVRSFLEGRIAYLDIPRVIEETLEEFDRVGGVYSEDELKNMPFDVGAEVLYRYDVWARRVARGRVEVLSRR